MEIHDTFQNNALWKFLSHFLCKSNRKLLWILLKVWLFWYAYGSNANMSTLKWLYGNSTMHSHFHWLLPASAKLGQGNIFTSVCQEFCTQGGPASMHAEMQPPGPDPPGSRPPWSRPPREQTPPPPGADNPPGADTPQNRHPPGPETPPGADTSIRSTSGRYASYWNAFLLFNVPQRTRKTSSATFGMR